MVNGRRPLLLEIFGSTGPRWSEIADFKSIFARSASAVTPTEKSSINTNRKSTTRFPMSPKRSSYVAPNPPPEGGGLKNANGRFPSKIALRLKKVCYKVSLWKTISGKVVRHSFISLIIRAKMIGGSDPFYLKFWTNRPPMERNRRFTISFRS